MAGIYIHVPFCKQACHYCDFHFSTSLKQKDDVLHAMHEELRQRASELKGESIGSIYFGGGTPSLLSGDEIHSFLVAIHDLFPVQEGAEITLEANPDDLSLSQLKDIKESGVNRLSIGIQSFRNEDLQLMNRAHNASEAGRCLDLAREAGFERISIDLIYGVPGMTEAAWEDNLNLALSHQPEHISAYCLTIESKTAFAHFIKSGKMPAPKDEVAHAHYRQLCVALANGGYDHYEVSNFCLPGMKAVHNSAYWSGASYLGIGPSAHSYISCKRSWNVSNNRQYILAAQNHDLPGEYEILEARDISNEIIMTGLRSSNGFSLNQLSQLGFPIHSIQSALDSFSSKGWIHLNEGQICPSEEGFWWSDHMASELFWVD